jgi:beta-phosphoglucomutase-like phosphatase (HAD superfamily)
MGAILNQAWEDVADDVTGAIEKAVQPLLKKAVDSIYCGLLETTQDYLSNNLAFNIASRISVAEREAAEARRALSEAVNALKELRNHGCPLCSGDCGGALTKAEVALLNVVNAVRDYLPPDGISDVEFIHRVVASTDNPTINPVIRKLENGRP